MSFVLLVTLVLRYCMYRTQHFGGALRITQRDIEFSLFSLRYRIYMTRSLLSRSKGVRDRLADTQKCKFTRMQTNHGMLQVCTTLYVQVFVPAASVTGVAV